MNFASLFNQFRSQSNSGLSDLLEQPSTRMSKLLEEDSFINEYKSGNSRLIEFMNYDRFLELVEFVTVVGPAEDKKRSYKYPLSACEVLTIDSPAALDFFFPDRPITLDQKLSQEEEVEVEVELEESPPPSPPPAEPLAEEPTKSQQPAADAGEKAPAEGEAIAEVTKPEVETPEKRRRVVVKKERRVVEKVVKREVQPLLNLLMGYFDGEVNYTLAGYVSKIACSFLGKKPAEFLRYFLQENVSQKVLNHAESRSVGDLIVKVLTHETTICLDQRALYFKAILDRLSAPATVEVHSNLSAYVCEIIEKVAANLKGNNRIPEFNTTFFSLDAVTQLIRNVTSPEDTVSDYNAPILYSYLTNVPFALPDQPQLVEDFTQLMQHFMEKSVEKLQVEGRQKLGTGRLKIVEILRVVLKDNLLNSRELVANLPAFFPTLLNLIKQYQMNNLLHNEIIKIIELALPQQPLSTALLALLPAFIAQEAAEDANIKAGTSVYKHRKGYIAHIINLSLKMKEMADSNPAVKAAVDTTEFSTAYEGFIEKELFNGRKSLAGFSMRKDIKHEIMFQKEEIIAAYLTFFQKCPSPVFEKPPQEEEQINIEHPDLVQELQKQLEQNLTIKPKEKPPALEPKQEEAEGEPKGEAKGEPKGEGENKHHAVSEAEVVVGEPNFWSTHLEYDVDDLLVDF